MKTTTRLMAALLCACMALAGCGCLKTSKTSCIKNNGSDSAMVAALGDSVARIILDAGRVDVSNLNADSTSVDKKNLALNKGAVKTLQFLLESPANYKTNRPVYGVFKPSIVYTFHAHRKQISVQCDFGLEKFSVNGKDGSQLAIYDLRNVEMLRFALTLYPNDKLLKAICKSKQK